MVISASQVETHINRQISLRQKLLKAQIARTWYTSARGRESQFLSFRFFTIYKIFLTNLVLLKQINIVSSRYHQ
jgi:hypothetical protein